jgi:hypothetical protein
MFCKKQIIYYTWHEFYVLNENATCYFVIGASRVNMNFKLRPKCHLYSNNRYLGIPPVQSFRYWGIIPYFSLWSSTHEDKKSVKSFGHQILWKNEMPWHWVLIIDLWDWNIGWVFSTCTLCICIQFYWSLSWSWSHGSWIFNYLCIQMLCVWTSFMVRCTWYNIMW